MIYRIVEHFDTIQGEGAYVGSREYFLRLAGCNVGRYIKPEDDKLAQLRVLNPEHSICQGALAGAVEFLCDTNFKGGSPFMEDELIKLSGDAPVIRLTGGEPLIWQLDALVNAAWDAGKTVRLETSGTLPIPYFFDYVTCAPKIGFLEENLSKVNEWKFVVDRSMGAPLDVANKIKDFVKNAQSKLVFIQSINGIKEVDMDNVRYAFEVVKAGKTTWRVGAQFHKFISGALTEEFADNPRYKGQ